MDTNPLVVPNQIWRDNYDFGTGYVRRIKVIAVDGDVVTIQALADDGKKAPVRKTKLGRFNGSKSGFTLE